MADRDPDKIKQDIDVARDQLATTVDALAERANPRRIADDVKAGVVQFVKKPAVAVSLAGFGTVFVVLTIRRITQPLRAASATAEAAEAERGPGTRIRADWRYGRAGCSCRPRRPDRRRRRPRRLTAAMGGAAPAVDIS